MRLQVSRAEVGQRVLIGLSPSEARDVIEQLQQGLAHQVIDRTHSHSILLVGTKESQDDVVHIIINGEVR